MLTTYDIKLSYIYINNKLRRNLLIKGFVSLIIWFGCAIDRS